MFIAEALQEIRKYTGKLITQVEFAKVLETSPVALNRRLNTESELKLSEAKKLLNEYNINLLDIPNSKNNNKQNFADAVEITYYENPNVETVIKNPLITSIWLDRELIQDIWKKDSNNLRILKMPGDVMDGTDRRIKNRDMLLIDLSCKDILCSGVYAYTTNDDNFIFVNDIKQKPDGTVKFIYWNSIYPDTIYTHEQLKNIKFKIIGRVIKNLSSVI